MSDYVKRFTGKDDLSPVLEEINENFDKMDKKSQFLNDLDKKFKKINGSTAPLKRQLKDLTDSLGQFNFNNIEGMSGKFLDIAKYAGQVKDSMDDARKVIQYFADDNRKLSAAIQGVQGAVGALSAYKGVVGLLGIESKSAEQAMKDLSNAMMTLNGLQQVAKTLNKDSMLVTATKVVQLRAQAAAEKMATAATVENTVATKAATIAQKAFNLVAKANPYVLIATAAVAAVSAIYGLTRALRSNKQALEEQKAIEEAVSKERQEASKTYSNLITKYNTLKEAWKKLRTEGEKRQFWKDNKNDIENLNPSIKTLNDLENMFVNNTQSVVDGFKKRAQAMAANTRMQEEYSKQFELQLKKEAKQQEIANLKATNKSKQMVGGSSIGAAATINYNTNDGLIKKAEKELEDFNKSIANSQKRIDYFDKKIKSLGGTGDLAAKSINNFNNTLNNTTSKKINSEVKVEFVADPNSLKDLQQKLSGLDEILIKHIEFNKNSLKKAERELIEALTPDGIEVKFDKKSILNLKRTINKQLSQVKLESIDASTLVGGLDYLKQSINYVDNFDLSTKELEDLSERQLEVSRRILNQIIALPTDTDEQKQLRDNYFNTLKGLNGRTINTSEQSSIQFNKFNDLFGKLNEWFENNFTEDTDVSGELIKVLKEGSKVTAKEINSRLGDAKELEKFFIQNFSHLNITDTNTGERYLLEKVEEILNTLEGYDKYNSKVLGSNTGRYYTNESNLDVEISSTTKEFEKTLDILSNRLKNGTIDINQFFESWDKMYEGIRKYEQDMFVKTGKQIHIELPAQSAEQVLRDFEMKQIEQMRAEVEIGVVPEADLVKFVRQVNNDLKDLDIDPIQIDITSDFEKDATRVASEFNTVFFNQISAIDGVVNAMENLHTVTDDQANSWEKFMSIIRVAESLLATYQTVSTLVTAVETAGILGKKKLADETARQAAAQGALASEAPAVVAANTAIASSNTATAVTTKAAADGLLSEAAAAIFAAHAAIPFAGVGIASGLITQMLASMAAFKAAIAGMSAFANGGIVGGSNFRGDRVLIRANSGEMILNKKQQANLFNALDKGELGGAGVVDFVLRGSDLYGSLRNYSKTVAKTGKITGIR